MAMVLKTIGSKGSAGSNPVSSANFELEAPVSLRGALVCKTRTLNHRWCNSILAHQFCSVGETADATDSKSVDRWSYRFKSYTEHQFKLSTRGGHSTKAFTEPVYQICDMVAWWNGRHVALRTQSPKGCESSNLSATTNFLSEWRNGRRKGFRSLS